MNAEQRKKEIYEYIKKQNKCSVTSLIDMFGVSAMTIRRDLDALEKQNLIQRTYGKAMIKNSLTEDPFYDQREATNVEPKQEIARKALRYLTKFSTVYIDGSSTCNELIKLIPPNISLTIFTNNLITVNLLSEKPWIKTYMFGGLLINDQRAFDSTSTMTSNKEIFVDASFISCSGFNTSSIVNAGILTINERRMMLSNSANRFLLADHSKCNVRGLFTICDWNKIDIFITDKPLDSVYSKAIAEHNVKIIY